MMIIFLIKINCHHHQHHFQTKTGILAKGATSNHRNSIALPCIVAMPHRGRGYLVDVVVILIPLFVFTEILCQYVCLTFCSGKINKDVIEVFRGIFGGNILE